MTGLRTAASFLTRVPVGRAAFDTADVGRSIAWFPVVGGLIGLGVAGVYAGALEIIPPLVAALLALGCGLVATGAFHEDGLADTADAFGGGWSRDDVLRIMKDPAHGTYGVLALVLSISVRAGAIASMDAWSAAAALVGAHAMSRAAAMVLLGAMPAATGEGLGASYGRMTRSRHVAGAAATGGLIGVLALGPLSLPAAAGGAVAAIAFGRLARAKIGGITGDVLGATQQGAEILVLLVAAAAVATGWWPPAWWR